MLELVERAQNSKKNDCQQHMDSEEYIYNAATL